MDSSVSVFLEINGTRISIPSHTVGKPIEMKITIEPTLGALPVKASELIASKPCDVQADPSIPKETLPLVPTSVEMKKPEPIVYHEKVIEALEKFKMLSEQERAVIETWAKKKYDITQTVFNEIALKSGKQPPKNLQLAYNNLNSETKKFAEIWMEEFHGISISNKIDWRSCGKLGLMVVLIASPNSHYYTIGLPHQWAWGAEFYRFGNQGIGNSMTADISSIRAPDLNEVIAYEFSKNVS